MYVNNPTDGKDVFGQLGLTLDTVNQYVADSYIAKGLVNAYSLSRRLTSSASNSLRVRRSSDSVQQDIGFNGTDVDNDSLTTFTGANSGLVVTLYDQVSSLDLTESTNANQARIVNSGTIEVMPSSSITAMTKVAASPDNEYSSTGLSIAQFSLFYLCTMSVDSTIEVGINNTSERIFLRNTTNVLRVRINSSNSDSVTTMSDDTAYVIAVRWRGSDGTLKSSVNTVTTHNTTHQAGAEFTFQAVRLDAGSASKFTELMYFNTYLGDTDFADIASEIVTNYSLPTSI